MQRRYSRPIPITGHARRNVLSFRSWHGTKTAHPTIIPLPVHPHLPSRQKKKKKKKNLPNSLHSLQRVQIREVKFPRIVVEKLFSIIS